MPTLNKQPSVNRIFARTPAAQAVAVMMTVVLTTLALPSVALAQTARAASSSNADGVVLNFVNTELDAVVRALGQFTGKNFLVDPRVKGQLNLVSETPVNRDTAYRMLLGALRMQGFAVVEVDGVSKVVPEADAKLQGGAVSSSGSIGRGDQLVTRVFKLNYESATNLVPVLRPMIAPNNPINAYPGNNTLVITDYADNLRRIADVIASVDTQSSIATDMIEIKNGIATDIAALLTKLLDPGSSGDVTSRVTAIADPRTNSVLLRASSPARARLARDLIAKLDNPNARATNMHVVYLRNAEAVKLAEVLRGVLTGQSGGGSGTGTGTSTSLNSNSNSGSSLGGSSLGGSNSNASSTLGSTNSGIGSSTGGLGGTSSLGSGGVANSNSTTFSGGGATVQADATTNTLIITAPEPLYRSLREIIDMLDVRRAQIFVESLIVEVTATTASEFGIQWLSGAGNLSSSSNGVGAFGGTAFGGSGTNILGVAANPASLGNGLSIGITNGSVTLPGVGTVTNLGFLARALESKSGTNILSTPNLLTLDNEVASIIVGQNVPFITGSYAQTTGSTVSPFQTVERKDVGLTLKVKPQVSEGGTVKMQIYQEVSSVDSATNTAGIITNKRAIESNVLVDDGQIIVLGGLVQDSVTGSIEKVPGLGDIPYLGALFRYDGRRRAKTNLMVFLRPYVVREGTPNSNLLIDRYEYMRAMQDHGQPGQHWLLPDIKGPELPPRVPGVGDPPLKPNSTGMMPTTVPRDMAALQDESSVTVLQVASAPSEDEAQRVARRVSDAGFNAAVVRGDNDMWSVRTRVARDMLTIDTTLSTLRQLGFSAEIVTRP